MKHTDGTATFSTTVGPDGGADLTPDQRAALSATATGRRVLELFDSQPAAFAASAVDPDGYSSDQLLAMTAAGREALKRRDGTKGAR